jgi:hypothetical protein
MGTEVHHVMAGGFGYRTQFHFQLKTSVIGSMLIIGLSLSL